MTLFPEIDIGDWGLRLACEWGLASKFPIGRSRQTKRIGRTAVRREAGV